MTDWIEHDGGPQPVADDVWVEVDEGEYDSLVGPAAEYGWGLYDTDQEAVRYRILNQHLIDAARLKGIRLGLDAAAGEVADIPGFCDFPRKNALDLAFMAIRDLNPTTIAKEATND